MQRANDLVSLHYGVKVKYAQNQEKEDAELNRARRQVDVVLGGLRDWEREREREKGRGRGRGRGGSS